MKKAFYILLFFLSAAAAFAQRVRLDPPLHRDIAPSGTFAEIRGNHYHGGLDLRIGGDTGIGTPVYAPADGYVSRLRISAYDGGKMLYINHGDNITTVYLHLDSYQGAIADYVLDFQRRNQCYSLDTTLSEGELPVHRGDIIAHAGNSGMSGGPHLHYEIRETRTQHTLNPLRFGLSIVDTMPPTLRGIKLYPVDKNSRVNGSKSTYQVDLEEGAVAGTERKPISIIGRFYIGVYADDMSKGSTFHNGYDRIDIWVDGKPFFQYCVTKIPNGDTRAINAQIDYSHYCSTQEGYVMTRRFPGDPIRPARTYGDGSIGFIPSDTTLHRITISVTDFNGNSTVRRLYVRNSLETLVPMHDIPEHPSYHLFSDSLLYCWPLTIHRGDYQIDMPVGMGYYDDLLLHGIQQDRRYISPIVTVRPWKSPYPPTHTWVIRMPIPIGYEPEQLVICRISGDYASALPTRIVQRNVEGKPGRWLEADARWYGNFVVKCDTSAPYVTPSNFKAGGKAPNVLLLKMGDNLSGVREYRCFVNDQWVLSEFDGKSATLSIDLSQVADLGKTFRVNIFLADACGNRREVVYNLKR